jgi:hypothetical protein
LEIIEPIPKVPDGLPLVTAAATLIRSSQVQVESSGGSTPAAAKTFGWTIPTGALTPALMAISPVSVWPGSTVPGANLDTSTLPFRSSSAPRPPYSRTYFSSIWMMSGASLPATWVASLSQ